MSLPLLAAARRVARLADPDAGLVARFARDADPAAFAELIARHGPAVWGVCRRAARTEADAEDVFQATFLVLARDAARVRRAASVGSWLFGVAVRLGRAHRRRARTPDPDRLTRPPAADPAAVAAQAELRAVLDEELAALPDTLRAPLLLCYYDGLTQDEAAAALGWSARAVKAKVARGRAVLRARLTRRGVELPTVLAVPLFAHPTPAPARTTDPLPGAAVAVARGRAPEGVSAAATSLARSGTAVFGSAVRLAALGVVLAVVAALGAQDRPAVAPPPAAVAPPPRPVDPLPPGGLHRLGSTLFRSPPANSRVFFTRDPDVIVLGGWNEPGRFLDVRTGRVVHAVDLPRTYGMNIDVNPGGTRLAVIGTHRFAAGARADAAVWVIDTATRGVLRRIDLPGVDLRGRGGAVRLSPDGTRVAAAFDKHLRVWDAATGAELARRESRNAPAPVFSPDGRTLAFGSDVIFVWRWAEGREPAEVTRFLSRAGGTLAFTPDGRSLVVSKTGGYPGHPRPTTLVTIDLATGRRTAEREVVELVNRLSFPPGEAAVSFAPGGHAPGRFAVHLGDPLTGQDVRAIPVGRVPLMDFGWSADGGRVAGLTPYRAWVWDAKTGRPVGAEADGHEAPVGAQAFTPDGTLFTAADDGTVRTWDAAGRPLRVIPTDDAVRDLAVAPDGSVVAGLDLGGTILVWDAKTGNALRSFGGGVEPHRDYLRIADTGGTRRLRFTADGARLVTWADDLTLRVWDFRAGRQLTELPTRTPRPKEDRFSTEEYAERVAWIGAWAPAAAISPNGAAFAYAAADGIRLVNPATGADRGLLPIRSDGLIRLDWSPDGRRVATIDWPQSRARGEGAYTLDLAVWDAATARKVWAGTVTGDPSARVGFTPDGSRVVVHAAARWREGHALRFFDAATGADAGRLDLPAAPESVAFDRTGRRVSVGFGDTTAVVFDTAAARAAP